MKIIVLMEDTWKDPAYRYEHGLSIYIETKRHRLLVDTGKTDAFFCNAKKHGIDLSKVDTVVLSHGHYDHGGGIMAFHKQNPKAGIYLQRSACGSYYPRPGCWKGICRSMRNCSCFLGLQAGNTLPKATWPSPSG